MCSFRHIRPGRWARMQPLPETRQRGRPPVRLPASRTLTTGSREDRPPECAADREEPKTASVQRCALTLVPVTHRVAHKRAQRVGEQAADLEAITSCTSRPGNIAASTKRVLLDPI